MESIFDYTVERWGLRQAQHYTDLIEATCAGLAEAPHQSQDCALIRPGYRRRRVERHAIYFRATDYGIAIIRILHQRMYAARHLYGLPFRQLRTTCHGPRSPPNR